MRLSLLLPLFTVACGYSQSRYADDMIEITCAKLAECDMLDFFGGTEEACQNYQRTVYEGAEGDEDTCPNYDSKSARECAQGWEDLTCAEMQAGQLPAACDKVCTAGSGG